MTLDIDGKEIVNQPKCFFNDLKGSIDVYNVLKLLVLFFYTLEDNFFNHLDKQKSIYIYKY